MDVQDFTILLTSEGQAALNQACALHPREEDYLRHFQVLAHLHPDGLARAALETAILRDEALDSGKFPSASVMYFTRLALEQASSHAVAEYRARRLSEYRHIFDLGCSIGGDALAFARHTSVTGVDIDAMRLAMARANAAALELQERIHFVQADLKDALPFRPRRAIKERVVYFDPARRSISGRRVFSIHDYTPPLPIVRDWLPKYPALCVKISPGVKVAELAQFSDAGLEFISLGRELKEAVLWFGPLRTFARRATLLPEECSLEVASEEHIPSNLPLSEPLEFLYEPDAAVLRAGLVTLLGAQINACQLDPDIAYLTGPGFVATPFARAWRVSDWFPFQLKRLRAYLRAHRVGQVVVKKRASPLDPDKLIHSLRLVGDEKRTLFLTHLRGKPIVIIAGADPIA